MRRPINVGLFATRSDREGAITSGWLGLAFHQSTWGLALVVKAAGRPTTLRTASSGSFWACNLDSRVGARDVRRGARNVAQAGFAAIKWDKR